MVLDNLANQFGGQVAVISIYSSSGSPPFFNSAAYQKVYNYPPPYLLNNTWYYATPWLWVDGSKDAAYLTNTWSNYISQCLQVPTDIDLQIEGNYDGVNRILNFELQLSNNGAETISGRLHAALTENDIQWAAPNGQQVHNHVPRIWWPDANGEPVSILPGDQLAVASSWNIHQNWNSDNLWVVAFLQDEVMQPDSTYEVFQGASIKMSDIITGISPETGEIAQNFQLLQNYPNPFNPATAIPYHLPKSAEVEIAIYNLRGQKIRTLIHETRPAGFHEVKWDGRDENGALVAGGVYLCRFGADSYIQARKMVLLK